MNQDLEHLRLLSIFHYVLAGITALCACFPIIHLVIGIVLLTHPEFLEGPRGNGPPPELFGLMFTIIPGLMIFCGWSLAVCIFFAGRYLSRHRNYMFCMVIAGLTCLFMPFGTVLGVFTIIVLARPSVRALFENTMRYDDTYFPGER